MTQDEKFAHLQTMERLDLLTAATLRIAVALEARNAEFANKAASAKVPFRETDTINPYDAVRGKKK